MEEDKLPIDVVYRRFWETARELAQEDIKRLPIGGEEVERDTVEKHLLGMLEMYLAHFSTIEGVGYLTKELARILSQVPDDKLRLEVNNLLLSILSGLANQEGE